MPTTRNELQEARAVLDAARTGRTATGRRECRLTAASSQGRPIARASAPAAEGTVTGHAAVFNTEAVIEGLFRETIAPGAFKRSLATDDIRVAFNHDHNFILGRNRSGTADFEEDRHGLRYTARVPDTTWAKDVLTSIARGDVSGSSFVFTVENDADQEWDFSGERNGRLPLRTIKRARVHEAGPVAFPAYEDTTTATTARGAAAPTEGPLDSIEFLEAELQLLELEQGIERPARRSADTDSMERELELLELEHGLRTGQWL